MNEDKKQKLITEYNLDIGKFRFYENIVVGEIKEGIHVTFEKAVTPLQITEQIYGDHKPIIYISNRVNSYSIDPMGYYEVIKLFPNLKGFAIVSNNKRRQMLVALERMFMRKPIRVFDTMDIAFDWAIQLLGKDKIPQKDIN